MNRVAVQFAALVLVLGVVAALAPAPWYLTDRDTYERVGREIIIPGCSDLHCFRIFAPAVIEQLPGPSLFKWKAYAVLANAVAAVMAGRLAIAFGLPAQVAILATWLSALGFGSFFTLFDPHTADPLMFALGPAITLLVVTGRTQHASVVSAIGVLAKEFAAAPLSMGAVVAWLAGRRSSMLRLFAAAAAVTALWVVFHTTLLTVFDYTYANSHSLRLSEGAYLGYWLQTMGARTAASALLSEFGSLYLLIPAGLLVAPVELRRWAIASIPAALAFGYVQQPDRALWNFHFVATPLAAIAVARLPAAAAWLFVAAYGVSNLRIGAQLPFVPPARFALAVSAILAVIAVVRLWRGRREAAPAAASSDDRALTRRERRGLGWVATATALALVAAVVVLVDSALHRRTERIGGLNKWGYRGPVLKPKEPDEIRVAVVGGRFAYGDGVGWEYSFPAALQRYVHQQWRPRHLNNPVSVVNLATPEDSPASFAVTLQDYDYLHPDVVIIVAEPGGDRADAQGWRRRSVVFRATGYLPALPDAVWRPSESVSARAATGEHGGHEEILDLVAHTVAAGRNAIVVTPPSRSAADVEHASALAAALRSRFDDAARVRFVNLDRAIDVRDPSISPDGIRLTRLGHEQVTEALTNPLLEMMHR